MIDTRRGIAIGVSIGVVFGTILMLGALQGRHRAASGSGGMSSIVVRGSTSQWHTMDYPSNWHVVRGAFGRTVRSIPESTTATSSTHWVKVEIYDWGTVDDMRDGDPWPSGTVTKTLALTRGEAVRYILPPVTSTLPGVSGVFTDSTAFVDIRPQSSLNAVNDDHNDFAMLVNIFNASSEQELISATLDVEAIISSTHFVDDFTEEVDWEWYEKTNPGVVLLDKYELEHPVGWVITEDSSSIYIKNSTSATYPAGSIWITMTPGVDWSVWNAAPLPYRGQSPREGPVAPVTANGKTTSQYLRSSGRQKPLLVEATVPDAVAGSDQYWLYDMTVRRILLGVYAWYASPEAYP